MALGGVGLRWDQLSPTPTLSLQDDPCSPSPPLRLKSGLGKPWMPLLIHEELKQCRGKGIILLFIAIMARARGFCFLAFIAVFGPFQGSQTSGF
jgi:hypothetical protein